MNDSISLDMSREAQSDRRIIKNNEQIVEGTHNDMIIHPAVPSHKSSSKSLGKIILISAKLNLSLGPHCINISYFVDPFFLLGFSMVLTVSSLLVYCSFALIKNQQKGAAILRVISSLLWFWVNTAYLITAFSDPGIYKSQYSTQNQLHNLSDNNLRHCEQCRIQVPNNVRHCYICAVCIEGLDHHCPWMSKCVGKKNIIPFYAFLAGVFSTMGLFWVTLYLIFSK